MRVAILGCGYVGLELGRRLTAAGHEVVGVRRSEAGAAAIERAGFDAIRADVTDAEALTAVPAVDTVVYAASAGERGVEPARTVYVTGLQTAIDHFGGRDEPPSRFVYTSSTGVYGDHEGAWVDETTPLDPETERERVLVEAERLALSRPAEYGIDGSVVRFAGLYGPDRYRIERYLTGPVTEGYLNVIHRDDAAGTVAYLLEHDLGRDEVVLAVDDEPVSRWTFADWLADECGVERPSKVARPDQKGSVDEETSAEEETDASRRLRADKRCSNAKLRELGYDLTYPTFREGYRETIGAYRAGE